MGEYPGALVIFLKVGARVVADSLAYFYPFPPTGLPCPALI